MNASRVISTVLGFALLAIYMLGSNYWVKNDGWYRSLKQPSFQPPDYVFGIIWPYNFIVIGIAVYAVAKNATTTQVFLFLLFFALSVLCALRWSYLFYGPHQLSGAAISLILTAICTIPMTLTVFATSWKLGVAFLPYQLWITIAAALSTSYSRLN